MKRTIVAVAGTFALIAGSAYAGGGCNYGSHASADKAETPVLAAVDEANSPELLAKLKAKEEAEALEQLIEAPVVYN